MTRCLLRFALVLSLLAPRTAAAEPAASPRTVGRSSRCASCPAAPASSSDPGRARPARRRVRERRLRTGRSTGTASSRSARSPRSSPLALWPTWSGAEVKLEDPASKYLPASARLPRETARRSRCWISRRRPPAFPVCPATSPRKPEEPLRRLHRRTVARLPLPLHADSRHRREYEYSNLGVGLLGHVLSRKAGMSYEELVTKRILEPLEMQDTAITLSAPMRAPGARTRRRRRAPSELGRAGARGRRGPALDGQRHVEIPRGKPGCGDAAPSALRETHKVAARRACRTSNPGSAGTSSTVSATTSSGTTAAPAATTRGSAFSPPEGRRRRPFRVEPDIDDIGLHLVEPRFPLAAAEGAQAKQCLRRDPRGLRRRIRVDPGVLHHRDAGGQRALHPGHRPAKLPIFPESETEFFLKAVDAQITFVREQGRVTGIVLHQNGNDAPGRRVK